MNLVAAVTDVELDCAFALYYAHGKPLDEGQLLTDGVVAWARDSHPEVYAELVVQVACAITRTLQKHAVNIEPIHSAPEVEL